MIMEHEKCMTTTWSPEPNKIKNKSKIQVMMNLTFDLHKNTGGLQSLPWVQGWPKLLLKKKQAPRATMYI